MTARSRAILLLAALLAAGPAAAGEPLVSVYTDLKGPACRETAPPPGVTDDHAPTLTRCPGAGGLSVTVTLQAAVVELAIGRGRKTERQFAVPGGFGPKVEWRGTGAGAAFRPRAAIVRMFDDTGTPTPAAVLGVLRIDRATACAAAWLAVAATPDANLVARRTADTVAETFSCGRDRAVLVGPETDATSAVIATQPE